MLSLLFLKVPYLLKVRQSRNDFSSWRFLQKTNEQIQFYYYETCFCLFFWRKLKTSKRHFEINWPLVITPFYGGWQTFSLVLCFLINGLNIRYDILVQFNKLSSILRNKLSTSLEQIVLEMLMHFYIASLFFYLLLRYIYPLGVSSSLVSRYCEGYSILGNMGP